MKSIRVSLICALVAVFTIISLFNPIAHAWPDKSGIWYTTSGQIVSGKVPINIYVTGTVDGLYYWLEGPGPTAMIPQKEVSVDSRPPYYSSDPHYYGFEWDTTKIPNGKYRWYASLKCNTCTTKDWVMQPDLKTMWLEYTVNNPSSVPVTPPAQNDNPTNNCSQKLSEANELTQKIVEKSQKRFLFVDNFLQQVRTFYVSENRQVTNYDALSKKTDDSRKKASDSMVILEQKSKLVCNTNLNSQINDFSQQLEINRDNLDAYRDDVINFILGIII